MISSHLGLRSLRSNLTSVSIPLIVENARSIASTSVRDYKNALNPKTQRLERILANRGLGSRSEVSQLLRQGRIKVKGVIVQCGKNRYPDDIEVILDDTLVEKVPLLAAYHKPLGVHCTMDDPQNRASLAELQFKFPFLKSMHPVGRLDSDTSGLLLFSRHGILTKLLLDPKTRLGRVYEAEVSDNVDHAKLKKMLSEGVKTSDGVFTAELLESHMITDANHAIDIRSKLEVQTSVAKTDASYIRIRVREGKYRMVRRILHNAGHSVIKLHRVAYGDIQLCDLPEGQVRSATEPEILWASKVTTAMLAKSIRSSRETAGVK